MSLINSHPKEVTNLTRITDEMVAGHKIDEAAVKLSPDASLVIAHQCRFDRRFAERYWPTFVEKPVGIDKFSNIEWRNHGLRITAKLSIGRRRNVS